MTDPTGTPATPPYADLGPQQVLDALDGVGLRGDGRLLQLNSYENRVYQVYLEDGRVVVAKFYRPGRWSDAQILEEHGFAAELAAAEIPVAEPWALAADETAVVAGCEIRLSAPTLAELRTPLGSYRFAVATRLAGRAPELEDPQALEWIGRYIGRIHAVGASGRFACRWTMDVRTFGTEPRDDLLAQGRVSDRALDGWRDAVDTALKLAARAFDAQSPRQLRLHGDCHPGNILWTDAGPAFVDLDDTVTGPAVQDLWMLLSGGPQAMRQQLDAVLRGYEAVSDFDRRELRLIEPLRTLRMIHHSAWIARRWHDPAFPVAFPWFDSPSYWEQETLRLREQIAAMAGEPIGDD
jgi:Ser/Thr protein kinase RdoA (MazF antagonist)